MLHPAKAQQFDILTELKDHSVKVYYSAGHEQRASSIANRVDKAMNYQQQQLGFKPSVILLVLSISEDVYKRQLKTANGRTGYPDSPGSQLSS